jgi:gas vesicle protein
MSKTGSFILGFAAGVGTVLAAAKFLSSDRGRDFQDRFKEVGDSFKDRVSDYYDYADSAAEDIKDNAMNKWDEFSDHFKGEDGNSFEPTDDKVTDLEFNLTEDGTMRPAIKDDTSEFQQATTVEDQVGSAVDKVKNAASNF